MSGPHLFTGPPGDPTRYHVTAADLEAGVAGGEGLVYRACRTGTDDVVALKVLASTSLADYDVRAERAEVLAGVRHPNLMEQMETFLGCPLSERPVKSIEDFDVPYSVARWIDGRPLAESVRTAGLPERIVWICDLAAALDHLHTPTASAPDGIVHRDVKPSNVRVRHDGHAVLLDYGVARQVDAEDMTEGIGTYLWRAPEVLGGSGAVPGTASDVWGLGALAHWMFVGEPPGLDGAAASRERLARSPLLSALPMGGAVARHLAELLHSSAPERPTDLKEWSRRLSRLAGARVSRGARALTAVAVVAALALVGWSVARTSSPGDPDAAPAPSTTTSSVPATLTTAVGSTPSSAAVPATTTDPADRFPDQFGCSGFSRATMTALPAIVATPRPIRFLLSDDSNLAIQLLCQKAVVPGDDGFGQQLRLGISTFDFPLLGCDNLSTAPFVPLTAYGSSVVATDGDTVPSVALLKITLRDPGNGDAEITVANGPLVGYRGTAPFTIRTIARDDNCQQGITSATVTLRDFTFEKSQS